MSIYTYHNVGGRRGEEVCSEHDAWSFECVASRLRLMAKITQLYLYKFVNHITSNEQMSIFGPYTGWEKDELSECDMCGLLMTEPSMHNTQYAHVMDIHNWGNTYILPACKHMFSTQPAS